VTLTGVNGHRWVVSGPILWEGHLAGWVGWGRAEVDRQLSVLLSQTVRSHLFQSFLVLHIVCSNFKLIL
jgi:hypothetical protein